jgi:hypothetical protein
MHAEELRWFNDWVVSWPVQVAVAAALIALVVIAFARSSQTFGEGPARTRFRVAVVLLGAALVLQALLTAATGRMVTPVLIQVIEVLWLFALWLYYFFRLLTGRRSGKGDPETQRRGVALDDAISRCGRDRDGPEAGDGEPRSGRAGSGAP